MLIIENFFLALSGLKTNKMRALLTMLGIIIGIAAVIAIVSIGDSISASFEKSMKDMGIENISVEVRQRTGEGADDPMYFGGDEKDPAESDLLTLAQINELKHQFGEKINAVSVTRDVGSAEARIGKKSEGIQLQGTNDGYRSVKKLNVLQGRYIEERDIVRSRRVAVIPLSIARMLEGENVLLAAEQAAAQGPNGSGGVIGSELKLMVEDKLFNYIVVGIYDDTAKSSGMFEGYVSKLSVYIPVTTAGELQGKQNYQSLELVPAAGVNSKDLMGEMKPYLERLYAGNRDWKAIAYNLKDGMDSYAQTMAQTKMAIAVIAGISLLVGGIGVMNIMLVSVTERTREIGVRKALGAKDRFIKLQFIVEAIIICGIGGIIGVSLGLIISAVGSSVMGNPFVVSPVVILISVAFSMSIGVFFGYYPANKAAALDPIDALRYE